ncbi:MAG: DUF1800 domain-containing protein [Shimia sp.]|uniref:DUF1800 domain-containing protein n=1 Tax=Shimia sp. TaxID=1954381 RepID=UPI0040587017
MVFSSTLAEHRFGFGLSPEQEPPKSVTAMLAGLQGEDRAVKEFPLAPLGEMHQMIDDFRELRKARKKAIKADKTEATEIDAFKALQKDNRTKANEWAVQSLLRRVCAHDGLRERLVDFWADHFSAPGKVYIFRLKELHYVEEAIRPNISGKFEDLLLAAVLHPQMLHFLDQSVSVGPNSRFSKSKPKQARGLNENLAREILELHTLGVGGRYAQDDVRSLAKLLTGVHTRNDIEMVFDAGRAEPGADLVLGQSYGGAQEAVLEDVKAVLRDLARHPDTAAHLARKMAVHFVSDDPDANLVAAMEAAYVASQGGLKEMVEAMLRHAAAWNPERTNFKQPLVFICSAMRALAVPPARLQRLGNGKTNRFIQTPLRTMGQPFGRPLGPDGFAEADAHWLSPQGLGARLQWSLSVPAALMNTMPDPRRFVADVVGEDAPREVIFAAEAAESKREGVALVLMSPAFQRM